eukprot:7734060-Alexandrium_andersonii.AAC.1
MFVAVLVQAVGQAPLLELPNGIRAAGIVVIGLALGATVAVRPRAVHQALDLNGALVQPVGEEERGAVPGKLAEHPSVDRGDARA